MLYYVFIMKCSTLTLIARSACCAQFHSFGIQHDGNGNDCEPVGKRPFVMSPQLLYGTFLPRWSRCSRQYITRFLE